jgi:transposase
MLRSALEDCFTQEKGKRVLWTSLASSKTCSNCLKPNEGLGASRTFTCNDCGHTDDRESNATANVLGQFLRKPGSFSADKKVAERLATKNEETAQMAAA